MRQVTCGRVESTPRWPRGTSEAEWRPPPRWLVSRQWPNRCGWWADWPMGGSGLSSCTTRGPPMEDQDSGASCNEMGGAIFVIRRCTPYLSLGMARRIACRLARDRAAHETAVAVATATQPQRQRDLRAGGGTTGAAMPACVGVGASARGRDRVVKMDVRGGDTEGGSRLGRPGGGCGDPRQASSRTTGGGSSDGRAVAELWRRTLSVDTPLCHRCPISTTSSSTWFLIWRCGCAPAVSTGAAMHGLASHKRCNAAVGCCQYDAALGPPLPLV